MRTAMRFALAMSMGLAASVAGQDQKAPATKEEGASTAKTQVIFETTKELDVTNVDCEGCAEKLQKALESIDGVSKAVVDTKTDKVKVTFDPRKVTDETLTKTLAKGWAPKPVEKEADATGK